MRAEDYPGCLDFASLSFNHPLLRSITTTKRRIKAKLNYKMKVKMKKERIGLKMSLNNFEFDGSMTQAHKERLEEWHSQQIDELLERVWKTDPSFRATMQALDIADTYDLSDLEYYMAGNVAGWAAGGFDEADWFEGLPDNRLIQSSFFLNNIPSSEVPRELEAATATLKSIGLWPWS